MTRSMRGTALGLAAALALAGCDRGADEAGAAADAVATPDVEAAAESRAAPAGDKAPGADAGGLAPAAAAASGEAARLRRLVSGYLDSYAQDAAGGWPRVRGVEDEIAAINAGQEHRWPVDLERGRTYALVGACDNECDNVDIVVEDASGREVGRDVLTDDYPIVQLTPSASGRYTVRIMLVTCTIEPCYVGGRLLQQ